MGQRFVKIVDDGTLDAEEGWILAFDEFTDDFFFVYEKSTALHEDWMTHAWQAATWMQHNIDARRAISNGYPHPD